MTAALLLSGAVITCAGAWMAWLAVGADHAPWIERAAVVGVAGLVVAAGVQVVAAATQERGR
jgi:hypothetical protein